ncbi:MAG: hypothetical protein JWM30_1998 [Burkholderia sp.]|nr:hypothetical protein [Burkholderia sp.]
MKLNPLCAVRPSAVLISAGYFLASGALAQQAAPTVSNDATNVYYSIPYTGTPTWVRVYLDTDQNASTGFSYGSYGIGAEYLVESGRLYRYSGSNGAWGWTFVKDVPFALSSGTAKVSVARADLKSPSALNLLTQTTPPDQFSGKITQVLSATTTAPAPTTTTPTTPTTPTTTTPTTPTTTTPTTPTTTTPTTTPTTPTTTTPTTPTTSSTPAATTSVSYAASTATITNPERGFFNQAGCNSTLSQSTLANYRASGITMVRCYFDMGAYVSTPLGQNQLNLIQTQMDNLRAAGLKAVIRFTYNYSSSNTDAALPMMLSHMDQLKPYLDKNKDVIATIEGGFIGSYGEGDNSANYGQTGRLSAQNWADRKTIATKLLQVVPAERMVTLHMPLEKTTFDGSAALTAAEAFNGSAKARHGHSNDCFLSTPTDWGTYTNTGSEYPYMQADTAYSAMGGETCKLNAPRTDCPTALSELAMFHWSYLNNGYNTDVLNSWRSQGCYTQVQQKLGYRFALQSGSYSMSGKPGGAFTANLTIQNQGWAAPFNGRDVELVFRNTTTSALYRVKLNADPRKWLAGQTVNVSENVTLPADMVKGNYALYLNLPDPMPTLRNRPEYAIQLANTSVWEASSGFNNLNHTVSIAP